MWNDDKDDEDDAERDVLRAKLGHGEGLNVEDRMLKWFRFDHLPEHLRAVSRPFFDVAIWICETLKSGPERTVALRKLLEAKDAAVRATVYPGE